MIIVNIPPSSYRGTGGNGWDFIKSFLVTVTVTLITFFTGYGIYSFINDFIL
jgi:hypothetical protein